uniref:Leucine zipper protein 2 n=1 Tax=Amphiprion percula TaxID=161767 RepID=A0A3P8RIX1_AMPPE
GAFTDSARKLKEVFSERSSILHQLSKTSKELDSIKGNLQSLKNDDSVAKKDVQRILELSHKQREEMKSLQAALQKQLDEANERAEKQQATDRCLFLSLVLLFFPLLQNKSLKNKLLSGHKLCDAYAEESKKIQAQLKELRYGKKDLIFKVSSKKNKKGGWLYDSRTGFSRTRTQRKPTHAQGEHANSMQKDPRKAEMQTWDLLAAWRQR